MAAIRNLVSRSHVVHAPHPERPDYFKCQKNGFYGAPVLIGTTDRPVTCRNCLRQQETPDADDRVSDPRRCVYCDRSGTRGFEARDPELGGYQCVSRTQCRRRAESWARRPT